MAGRTFIALARPCDTLCNYVFATEVYIIKVRVWMIFYVLKLYSQLQLLDYTVEYDWRND